MMLIRHSLLNLKRHIRRTLMIWLILGVGLCALFLMNSYRMGLYKTLADIFRMLSGDFQIAQTGHWDVDSDKKIRLDGQMFAQVTQLLQPLQQEKHIRYADPVLDFNGMIGTSYKNQVVGGSGITLASRGRGVGGMQLVAGEHLSADQAEEVMLGKTLAKYLNVKEEDWVTILTSTIDGQFVPRSVQVRGVFTTGNTEGDRYSAIVPLQFLQQTMNTDGADVVQVYHNEGSKKSASQLMLELRQEYERRNLPLEMRTWEELNPIYTQLLRIYDSMFQVLIVLIAVLAIFAIFEMTSMSFLERLKELGTLRAVGNTRAQIFQLLFLELFFLAVGGLLLGIVLSLGSGIVLNELGIPFTPPNSTVAYPLYFPIKLSYLLLPSLVLLLVSLLSGLWPAITATRLNVVEVLRHD